MAELPMQLHGIVTPHEHDVLSGRGNFVNYHTGNEHFRALVRKHKVAYVACPKPQKGKFSKLIVDEIRALDPPGRFLKQDEVTKLWYEIGDKKAMDKTRQALREGAPDIMRELQPGEEGEGDFDGADDGDHDSPITRTSPALLGALSSSGFGGAPLDSPHRQPPARSVSLQPHLLSGFRRDNSLGGSGGSGSGSGNEFSALRTQSPGAYLSPSNVGLHNTVHGDARLQPVPSLDALPGQRPSHSHQAPQRTTSLHLATTGNLVAMQQHILASQQQQQPPHSRQSDPSRRHTTLSQHFSRFPSAQPTAQELQMQQQQLMQLQHEQRLLQRQQELLMQQRQQTAAFSQAMPSSQQALLAQQQQQQFLHQQRIQQQQQLQQLQQQQQSLSLVQGQMTPQIYGDVRNKSSFAPGLSMPLYQSDELAGSSGGAYAVGSSHNQYQQSMFPSAMGQSNPTEPLAPVSSTAMAPPMSRSMAPADNRFGESDPLGPLPSKSDLKFSRDGRLKRENSEGSLQVDSVFPTVVKTKLTDGGDPPHSDHKNPALSASHMSIMSLSMGDMGLGDDSVSALLSAGLTADGGGSSSPARAAAPPTEDALASRFNSSLRLGRRGFRASSGASTSLTTKRSSTASDAAGGDVSQNLFMDMSVATLGDRLSDFGDLSAAPMMDSQANMSFSNVFEEAEDGDGKG